MIADADYSCVQLPWGPSTVKLGVRSLELLKLSRGSILPNRASGCRYCGRFIGPLSPSLIPIAPYESNTLMLHHPCSLTPLRPIARCHFPQFELGDQCSCQHLSVFFITDKQHRALQVVLYLKTTCAGTLTKRRPSNPQSDCGETKLTEDCFTSLARSRAMIRGRLIRTLGVCMFLASSEAQQTSNALLEAIEGLEQAKAMLDAKRSAVGSPAQGGTPYCQTIVRQAVNTYSNS